MEKRMYIFLLVVTAVACQEMQEKRVLVRIENTSPFDYEEISLQTPEKTIFFGNLQQGETTYYQLLSEAHSFPSLAFKVNGRQVQPGNALTQTFVKKLPNGSFTYQVSVAPVKDKNYYHIGLQNDIGQAHTF